MDEEPIKPNYIRRFIGVSLCISPLVLSLFCLFWPRTVQPTQHLIGLTLVIISCFLALLNCYLSFIRPWLYQQRYGSNEGYRFISGFPLLGTIFQILGCSIGFGSAFIGGIGVISVCFDTEGLPWFVVATWKDTSFWDK